MNSPEWVPVGTTPSAPLSQSKKVGLVKRTPSPRDRREFIRGVTVASIGSAVALNTTALAASQPRSGGAIVHAQEGQRIPKTPDGRQVREQSAGDAQCQGTSASTSAVAV